MAAFQDGDDVNCAVCMDKLSNAKYLKCFHSFCTRCLEHCVRNLKVSCPLCREVTNVSDGIGSLLPNLNATKRVKEAKVRERIQNKMEEDGCQCESCKDLGAIRLAKSYCVECRLLICETCVSAHKLLKMTRGHRIIDVLEFQNNVSLLEDEQLTDVCDEGEERCKLHAAPLSMFCWPCELPVCPQCALLEHRSELNRHECVNFSELRDKVFSEIRQLLSKVEPASFDKIAEAYKRRHGDVSEKGKELRSKVNEAAQSEVACLYAKIEAKRQELNSRISEIEKSSSRKVGNALSGVRRLRSRAEKLEGYAEELLKTRNLNDIMAVRVTLTDSLKDIKTELRKLTPNEADVHELHGYTFVPTDWMASKYEPSVGNLQSTEVARGEDCKLKRRLSVRNTARVGLRPSSLPRINLTHLTSAS